jgi:ribonuclease HI
MSDTPNNTNNPQLRIIQINVNKSNDSQTDFLINRVNPNNYDLVMIQEPYFDYKKDSRVSSKWIAIYPLNHIDNPLRTRSMILVNAKISTNSWTALAVDCPDITAIQLTGEWGTLRIFNIYNDQTHFRNMNALSRYLLTSELEQRNSGAPSPNDIWLGDFNRHSPMWDEARNSQLFTRPALREAQRLIDLAVTWNMHMALRPGVNTLESTSSKNYTRPDNVWVSDELRPNITQCDVLPSERPVCTDHLPIITKIDVSPTRTIPAPRYNWRDVAWSALAKDMKTELAKLPIPHTFRTILDFETSLNAFTNTLDSIIEKHVPKTKPTPFQKRWWSGELADKRNQVRKLARKVYRLVQHHDFDHPTHEEHRTCRNAYTELIRSSKQEHWIEWLERADDRTIWTIHRFITSTSGDGAKTRIPNLKVKQPDGTYKEVKENKDKAKALYDSFFFPPPQDDGIAPDYEYPPPCTAFQNITDEQIHRAIKRLKPYKGTGPDQQSNSLYKNCRELLVPHLGPYYRATFDLKHYPAKWKHSITDVLRKPDKPNYSLPKAYRPITRLNTIAKILSSAVSEDLVHMSETHNLLPANHFGGRPGRSTTDSLMLAVHWTFEKWRKGLVVSGLFLDISGAFPNAVIPRVIHNMRRRKIPVEYAEWTKRRMTGRKTVLTFDDYQSEPFEVTNGLDQGDPPSSVFYGFYNADLIEPSRDPDELKSAFVDDTMFFVAGKTYEANNAKLTDMMTRQAGAREWSQTHNSDFEIDKFALLHLSRKREPDPNRPRKTRPIPRPPLHLADHTILPSVSHKFLGVVLDQTLNFKEHANYALGKGEKYAAQLRRLAQKRRGVPSRLARNLHNGVVLTKMLYAAEVWCSPIREPEPGKKKKRGSVGFAAKLARVQRTSTIFITGALRSTPTVALDAHAGILPMHLAINKVCQRAAMRFATLPRNHPLAPYIRRAASSCPQRLPSPLHHIMDSLDIHPDNTETINPVRQTTKWQPGVKTRIAPSKDIAILEESCDPAFIRIYSDGSGIEGNIGAAAVLYHRKDGITTKQILRFCLGPETRHTVYEGEVVGEIMAQELLYKAARGFGRRVSMYVDNQASIISTQSIKPTPGHYLLDILHNKVARSKKKFRSIDITIRWIPSHLDVEGNEQADEQAKRAAKGDSSPIHRLPAELRNALPDSISAIKQATIKAIKVDATRVLRKSPQWRKLRQVDPTMPSNRYRKMADSISRKHSSLLIQLRTGHAPLNKHLFNMKCADSPICPACEDAYETVHHFLLTCPAYERHRRNLFFTLRRGSRSLATMLSHPKTIKQVFKFIGRTGRFKATHGDLDIPDDVDVNSGGRNWILDLLNRPFTRRDTGVG